MASFGDMVTSARSKLGIAKKVPITQEGLTKLVLRDNLESALGHHVESIANMPQRQRTQVVLDHTLYGEFPRDMRDRRAQAIDPQVEITKSGLTYMFTTQTLLTKYAPDIERACHRQNIDYQPPRAENGLPTTASTATTVSPRPPR